MGKFRKSDIKRMYELTRTELQSFGDEFKFWGERNTTFQIAETIEIINSKGYPTNTTKEEDNEIERIRIFSMRGFTKPLIFS